MTEQKRQVLKEGDMIRVISPSDSFFSIQSIGPIAASKIASELGLTTTFGKHCAESPDIQNSSSVDSRIEDIHSAFQDPAIKAIIASTGGFNSIELLPHINWSIIKANPKPLIGSSDITVLLNAVYAKTGVVTYYGPNFYRFGMKEGIEYSIEYLRRLLFTNSSYIIEPSSNWSEDKWWKDQNNRNFKTNQGPIVCSPGEAEGIIVGGNLCSLNLLQGTEFLPKIEDSMLFIEDDSLAGGLTFGEFNRNLQSILLLPNSHKIKGVIIGRFQSDSCMTIEKIKYLVNKNPILKNIPVLANVDFGHTDPCYSFPIGGKVRVTALHNKIAVEVI